MSAESGIPTFRDALTGLWSTFDAAALATPQAFARDPALVWGWYRWRAARVRAAVPNAGHAGIAALASDHDVAVVTQNVDDLHERAGSRDVVHLHGSLFATRCARCGSTPPGDPILDGLDAIGDDGAHEAPPACADCGGPMRPGVVWFGEPLPAHAWRAATAAIDSCEQLVVVGTSGLVQPAASLPQRARDAGARVIEINPVASAITPLADESWRMPASAGVERLLAMLGSG